MKNNVYLITGGCGFIGSNFINYILDNHFVDHVVNIDKLTYAGNSRNLQKYDQDSRYSFIQGDICDQNLIGKVLETHQPNVIVHFAAESHVDRSIDGPAEFIRTNISGTYTLLQESLKYYHGIKEKHAFRFHHISTDEVFGSLNSAGFFTEETKYNPSSPYSASKASSDHLARAWQRTFGLPVLISNCSNNYGPYQFPEKLIPLMILNCLAEKALPVYGQGENIRDWLYVFDHCSAIYQIIEHGKTGETYNVGGNNEIKNLDIVKTICSLMDEIQPSKNLQSYHELITFVQDRPGHDFRYAIDSSKLKNELDWKPKETFETGIRKTVHWYLENQEWWAEIQKKSYRQDRLGILK